MAVEEKFEAAEFCQLHILYHSIEEHVVMEKQQK